MPELQRAVINPDTISKPLGAYSQLTRVKASELVFIAGQVSVNKEGNIVGEGDAYARLFRFMKTLAKHWKKSGPRSAMWSS